MKKENKKKQQNWRQFSWNLEALEKSWLEPFNFQIDSSNWDYELDEDWAIKRVNWHPVKVNPEWDIHEITMPDWTKERLFDTEVVVIRETSKVWKRYPTPTQWEQICKPYWNDVIKLSKELNMPIIWTFSRRTNFYYGQWILAYYWSFFDNTVIPYNLHLTEKLIDPKSFDNRVRGFALRCFKN